MATQKGAKYHFIRSNYVTWFTDWLLGLGGKSAHVVLIFTTLYMSAELYPGVNLPPGLNMAVFLIQMFSLDMGGMGLASLARQARADGNQEGAKKAQGLSRWLIGIMIAGLVTVCLEQALKGIPGAGLQTFVDAAKTVVEFALVIARAVCAVLYGTTIHSLKSQGSEAKNEAATSEETAQRLEKLQSDLQSAKMEIADLTAKLQTAKLPEQTAKPPAKETAKTQGEPAKSSPAKSAAQPNITNINQARARHEGDGKPKVSHAEVVAFMTKHPDLKRSEVAAKLGISERKVYDALAWSKDQESAASSY
jgi:hypothetical protein